MPHEGQRAGLPTPSPLWPPELLHAYLATKLGSCGHALLAQCNASRGRELTNVKRQIPAKREARNTRRLLRQDKEMPLLDLTELAEMDTLT